MRSLKAVVIVLGAALVAGGVALAALIVARIERGPAAQGAATLRTALPAGSRIVATELNGDRLLIRLALADGREELVLVNARTGVQVAVYDLPAPR